LSGVGLAQFGEFGFVLTRLAQSNGVIEERQAAPLLAAGILSMFLTPLLARWAPHVRAGERLLAVLERVIGVRGIDEPDPGHAAISGHVIVVGFGLAGRYATKALLDAQVPVLALELNANNVKRGREAGLPVYYGDATSEEALRHARLDQARLVVLLMNDPQGAQRIVDTIRRTASHVPLLMRTRYLLERPNLIALGASEVVVEEVEGTLEIITRMLAALEVPEAQIESQLGQVRRATAGAS
jgi:CPA2 family monovalent cation:H+ antiporter-2